MKLCLSQLFASKFSKSHREAEPLHDPGFPVPIWSITNMLNRYALPLSHLEQSKKYAYH